MILELKLASIDWLTFYGDAHCDFGQVRQPLPKYVLLIETSAMMATVHQQQSEDLHLTRLFFLCSQHFFELLIKNVIGNSRCCFCCLRLVTIAQFANWYHKSTLEMRSKPEFGSLCLSFNLAAPKLTMSEDNFDFENHTWETCHCPNLLKKANQAIRWFYNTLLILFVFSWISFLGRKKQKYRSWNMKGKS